jgi:hypothetical protein
LEARAYTPPTLVAASSVHLGNGRSQETTERPSKRSSGEEESGTETEFLALVPAAKDVSTVCHHGNVECLREVVVDARKQTSLSDTEEETAGVQAGLVRDDTHEGHDDAPHEDDAGEEDAGRPSLDGDVGQRLEAGVRDEKNGQGDVVVGAMHMERLLHVGHTCVSDVGPVQEGQEVQQRKPRNQPQIHFPNEGFVLCGVSDVCQGRKHDRGYRTSLARSSSLLPASGSGSTPS